MRRTRILWTACVLWSAVSATTIVNGQQAAAHVLDVKGAWRLDGTGALLTAGQGLMAGAKVIAASDKAGDAITIVRDEDMSRTHVSCDDSPSNPCRIPIVVQGSDSVPSTATSQLKGIVQAAWSVLLSRPPAVGSRYALTMTRGLVSVEESEAVVPLDRVQGVVLPAAPERIPPGRYTISVSRTGQPSSLTSQIGVLSSDGTWGPLQLGPPGLYEVSILYPNQEQVTHMILLVTPMARYQITRDAFDAMKARTSAWTGSNARSDEHVFLRAFLLSESQPQ